MDRFVASLRGTPRSIRVLISTLFSSFLVGCQVPATLHVWSPPSVVSAVGKRIAIAPLTGPDELAKRIGQGVQRTVPQDPGRATQVFAIEDLRGIQPAIMQVAMTENLSSDLAALPLARSKGMDYVLHGEVLRRPDQTPHHQLSNASAKPAVGTNKVDQGSVPQEKQPSKVRIQPLSVAWRLYSVEEGKAVADRITVVDPRSMARGESSAKPPLSDDPESLASAIGAKVWEMMTPYVRRMDVQLAVPWIGPGSQAIRQANRLAREGKWPEAEFLWFQALQKHPRQHAAAHNLAIAAVAKQNFSDAKRWIRAAIGSRNRSLYQQTIAWIEIQQRSYHVAFNLPDPPDGWYVTSSSPQTP